MRIKFSALLIGMLISTGLMAQKPSGYVLNEGDRFEVHSEIKQTVDQTIMGQVMQTKQTITSVEEYEVVAVTPTGYRLKNTALAKKLDLTSPQGSAVVDSEMEGDEHLAFKVMIGKSFFVEMDKHGKSLKLEGLEDLKSKIKTELAGTILEGQTD